MPRLKPYVRVWMQHHGPVPQGFEVDHKDGNKRNNAIENLRLATREQNNFNRARFKNNRSGEKNVLWDAHSRRWMVRVFASGTRVYAYASHKISAIVAARLIRRVLHGEFACDRNERILKAA